MFGTKIYRENLKAWKGGARLIANKGGTRSGKTYSLVSLLVCVALQSVKKRVIDVVSESLPHLKRGALNDIEDILSNEGLNEDVDYTLNRSDHIYTFTNTGTQIRFFSADDWGKVKGSRRDVLFINECNRVNWEIYRQLVVRTTEVIFLDWNPDSEFWYELKGLNTKDNTVEIHSTYLDNPFLTPMQVAEIESNREDENWWRVYGLGLTGMHQGLIYQNWELCDEVPDGAKLVGHGLDFGFTCFKGDTLIMTENGQQPIEKINPGDMVLTRKGFKKVVRKFNNGVKKVVTKEINIGGKIYEVSATENHNFNINGKWKKYGELQTKDKLCVLSSLTVMSSKDTQTGNTQTTTITSGKKMEGIIKSCCIMPFTSFIKEKFQTVVSFIILIVTHLITTLATLLQLPHQNICAYMAICQKNQKERVKHGLITKIIGKIEEKLLLNDCNQHQEYANGAEKNILRPMYIKDSVPSNAIIGGNINRLQILWNWFVNVAAKHFKGISILNQNHVVPNVHINYRQVSEIKIIKKEYCEVYDLQVEDVHEYFANGILVHNCDPTAIVDVYLQDGKLWIDERCYEKGLTNDKIADRLRACKGDIVADSAEMKSITEIYNYGIKSIEPAVKGSDSIRQGIQVLHRYKLMVTKRSLNLINELRNYKWKEDKITGEQRNEPIDKWNHALDALRYLVGNKLSERAVVQYQEYEQDAIGEPMIEIHPLLNGMFVYCRANKTSDGLFIEEAYIRDTATFDVNVKGDVHIEVPMSMMHYVNDFRLKHGDVWARPERGGKIGYIESFKEIVRTFKFRKSDEMFQFRNNLSLYDGKNSMEAIYVLSCLADRMKRKSNS